MKRFCATGQVWFELLTRILCDSAPPMPTDIAYLSSETVDHQESVLRRGAEQIHQNKAKRLGIYAIEGSPPYPGGSAWREELVKKNVNRDIIVLIEHDVDSPFPPSTAGETFSLVKTAAMMRWNTISIISTPPHQVRTFCSAASAVIQEGAHLFIYSVLGEAVDWKKIVVLSQSVPAGPEYWQLSGEYSKIERYFRKGDMVSARQILDYLNRRG